MPLFTVKPKFQYGDRFWENVYTVTADAIGTVVGTTSDWETFCTDNLLDTYTLAEIIFAAVPSGGTFVIEVLNQPGALTSASRVLLPLFDTVLLELVGGTIGRQGKKFLRGLLTDADLNPDGTVSATAKTGILTRFNTLLTALTTAGVTLEDGAGKVITSANVASPVQMRQLHRKRRKVPVGP